MPHIQTRKMFLVNQKTMKRHCIDGLKASTEKSTHRSLRKKFKKYTVYSSDELPPKVDLRPWMTPVEDQSDLNSCTANAIAGIYEYLVKRSTNKHTDVSRLFIYYNARKKEKENDNLPLAITDEGASITSTIDTLKELGACPESSWPYLKAIVNDKPTRDTYMQAKGSTITEALEVPVDLYYMKSCLAQGFPFLFGLQLYASFDKAASNGGVVPMPKSSMAARSEHGSHALLAVGYSEASQAFIVRNSWGEDWGDNGYCYIPYEYMTNKDLCSDVWIMKRTSSNTLGTEHWVMQDTVNYLAPNLALGLQDYTDDSEGLSIEPIIVRDRVPDSIHLPRYGEASTANYARPSGAHDVAPAISDHGAHDVAPAISDRGVHDVAPAISDRGAPPIPNYAAPPFINYTAPSFSNYGTPPFANYTTPPFGNYAALPFSNYAAPSIPYYAAPTSENYAAPSMPYYAAPPSENYAAPPFAPYDIPRGPIYRRPRHQTYPIFDNYDQSGSLFERIFLKP